MTGYHIYIGYNSGLTGQERASAFEVLKAVVGELRRSPLRIVDEALREHETYSADVLRDYAKQYAPDCEDATIRVLEPANDQPGQIMQLASGGGEGREIKELMRRAFARLLIMEMHRKGIEVSFSVV